MTVTEVLIAQLHPEVQGKCRVLLETAKAAGIELCVTHGYRSPQQQAKLYAQGRTTPGPVVTRGFVAAGDDLWALDVSGDVL